MVLGGAGSGTGGNIRHRVHQQPGTQLGQPVVERYYCFIGINRGGGLGDDVSCIQVMGHMHDGYAGFGIAVEYRPVDRSRPPIVGQQRGMDVDTALGRSGQNVIGEDTPIGCYHNEFRSQLLNQGQSGAIPQLCGLIHRDIVGQGTLLHRRGLELHTPVFGLIWLGEYAAQVVTCLDQGLQRGYREIRRAHKEDPHACSSPSASISSSSSSLVYSRSVSSENRWPSRWSISWQKQRATMSSPSTSKKLPFRS